MFLKFFYIHFKSIFISESSFKFDNSVPNLLDPSLPNELSLDLNNKHFIYYFNLFYPSSIQIFLSFCRCLKINIKLLAPSEPTLLSLFKINN